MRRKTLSAARTCSLSIIKTADHIGSSRISCRVNMANWHAFIEDDAEGNVVIYLQNGEDKASREFHDMSEHDVKDSMLGQENPNLAEAGGIADERNEVEESEE